MSSRPHRTAVILMTGSLATTTVGAEDLRRSPALAVAARSDGGFMAAARFEVWTDRPRPSHHDQRTATSPLALIASGLVTIPAMTVTWWGTRLPEQPPQGCPN